MHPWALFPHCGLWSSHTSSATTALWSPTHSSQVKFLLAPFSVVVRTPPCPQPPPPPPFLLHEIKMFQKYWQLILMKSCFVLLVCKQAVTTTRDTAYPLCSWTEHILLTHYLKSGFPNITFTRLEETEFLSHISICRRLQNLMESNRLLKLTLAFCITNRETLPYYDEVFSVPVFALVWDSLLPEAVSHYWSELFEQVALHLLC